MKSVDSKKNFHKQSMKDEIIDINNQSKKIVEIREEMIEECNLIEQNS